jgi:hypothetical protein
MKLTNKILVDLEKAISSTGDLLFEFAVSLILIPKTFFKVLTNPVWAIDYVSSEYPEKAKARFEKYSHPILFWIVIGILPYYILLNIFFMNIDNKKIVEAFREIGAASLVSSISIYLVSFPVSCAFILHVFKHRVFVKSTFKRTFFTQLYITAPVQFFYCAYFLIFGVDDSIVLLLLSLTFFAIFIWFSISEITIIRVELNFSFLKGMGIFILMYLSFFIFAMMCFCVFFAMNIQSIQKLVDAVFEV